MNVTILRFDEQLEDVDIDVALKPVHIEYDGEDGFTLYGDKENGKLPYIVLDKPTMEWIYEFYKDCCVEPVKDDMTDYYKLVKEEE